MKKETREFVYRSFLHPARVALLVLREKKVLREPLEQLANLDYLDLSVQKVKRESKERLATMDRLEFEAYLARMVHDI